ncbi:ATP-binding cassette domain-containing protein [Streptomyces cyaneofuscatus]|uniref:ATP-binding cassette domain-containing protein n=1 Tax=Streptomyces cyaneofuscatus TaxID=66883 RepID=UPI003663676F
MSGSRGPPAQPASSGGDEQHGRRDGRRVRARRRDGQRRRRLVRRVRPVLPEGGAGRRRRRETRTGGSSLTTDDVTGISLQVHAGEVVGLAGLIGAGRSELALALAGDLPVRSGTATLDGELLRSGNPGAVIRAGLGLAPEERKAQALFLQQSIRDNTSLVVLDRLRRFRFIRRDAERTLAQKFSDLLRVRTPSIDHEVRELSGGNQQKVVLARWLARNPKVLILDEPTRGIDVGAKAEIYQIIADLAADGIALLVISSELPELLGLADRVVVMQGGRITGELDRSEATEESILELAMADDIVGAAPGGTS